MRALAGGTSPVEPPGDLKRLHPWIAPKDMVIATANQRRAMSGGGPHPLSEHPRL
jgi:hypothetical protein